MRHIWGDMTYYRPPVRHWGGRVPLSPAGFTPLVVLKAQTPDIDTISFAYDSPTYLNLP